VAWKIGAQKENIYNTPVKKISSFRSHDIHPKFKVERVTAMETLTDRVSKALQRIDNDKNSKPGVRLPSEPKMAGRLGSIGSNGFVA
jgi:hypothetical protein